MDTAYIAGELGLFAEDPETGNLSCKPYELQRPCSSMVRKCS
jgi:hypothetical protein